jgi:hypothetical protein
MKRIDTRIKVLIAVGVLFILAIPVLAGLRGLVRDLFKEKEPVLKDEDPDADTNIIFLHHSTGRNIWEGGVPEWFSNYNSEKGTNYSIIEQNFPKREEYGWNNYPYDYWNIWVNNAGDKAYKNEPTLEMITRNFDVIVFKHCFPVSNIEPDTGDPDVSSDKKTVENYKLQYEAFKEKMKEFSETKFIVWTGAALVRENTDEESAKRAREFFDWVRNDWDEEGDNIFLWDFYELQTEGGLYLKDEYARNPTNSHPNEEFSGRVAPLFSRRIVDVIEGRGDTGNIDGSV